MGWNILKEQIFPVIYASGKRASLGMYDVLKEADKIQEIHTGCPGDIGDFLLTRLLTAFVQAAYQFRKTDLSDKLDALAEGSMDMNKIDRYIQYCENKGVSFELTGNGERLFLQPETDLKELKNNKSAEHPLTAFAYWVPSGNADVFHDIQYNYDANTNVDETGLTATEYLCALLHNYFCHSGNATSGKDGVQISPGSQIPSYILLHGNNLFETLILSCGHMGKDQYGRSLPIWEAPERTEELNKLDPNNGETGNLAYIYTRNNVFYPGQVNPDTNRIEKVYWLWSRIDFKVAQKYWAMNDPHIIRLQDDDHGVWAERIRPLIDQPWMECTEVLPCDRNCQNSLLRDLVVMRKSDQKMVVPQKVKLVFYFYQYKYKGETINTIYNSKAVIEENIGFITDSLMTNILRDSVRRIRRTGDALAKAVRWSYYKQIHPDVEWDTSISSPKSKAKKPAIEIASQEYCTIGESDQMMLYHAMRQFIQKNEEIWYEKRKEVLSLYEKYKQSHFKDPDVSIVAKYDNQIRDVICGQVKEQSEKIIHECFQQNGMNSGNSVLAAESAKRYLRSRLRIIFEPDKENKDVTNKENRGL